MSEETKVFRFIDPISQETVSLRIKKTLIKQQKEGKLSTVTYLHKDHALILYIDGNFVLRGVEASIFLDNKGHLLNSYIL